MRRVIFTCMLFSLLLPLKALSQNATTTAIAGYTYHPMREDPASWQRLAMWMGATFTVVAKEGQVDIDSCVQAASRSMGISRLSIVAEGIGEPEFPELFSWVDDHAPSRAISLLKTTSGKTHLQLLTLLGAWYAFQPHNYFVYRDSAEYFLEKAIQESRVLKEQQMGRQALALLVKLYALGNDARADTLGSRLIHQCKQAGDKATAARVLAYRSKFTPPAPTTIARKLDDAQQAAALCDSIGDYAGEINALTDLGYLQIITGEIQKAYENHQQALKLAEKIHFPYTHYNTQALMTVTNFQGKFGEPLRYSYQTIKTAEATRDSLAWGYFYANLAIMYDVEGRNKESVEWAKKSTDRFIAQRNSSVYLILIYLINDLCRSGKGKEAIEAVRNISLKTGYPTTVSDQFFYHEVSAICYTTTGFLSKAEAHIKKMDELETLAETYRGPVRRSEVNARYAILFMKRKQYRKARAFFEKQFIAPGRMDNSLASRIAAYTSIIDIDSILGDHAGELEHYKKYTRLLDSSFRITKTRQAEELQVTYQINEKENQITSLTQQAGLEKANSEKSALLRNFSMAGVAAAVIIAGLVHRQSRQRKRTNLVISRKNVQLEQLVADKEWLLKEIHHRVKNNLQIIISLLDSQSEYIKNDAALAAIEDNMRRVHAMALIHQKLYLTDNVSFINMPEYINELVLYARDSFDTGNRISFAQEIEYIELDVSQAIPLGLIINESVVNAIKYAFKDNPRGAVRIQFYEDETGYLVLKTSDNGIGLPEAIDIKTHPSLGLNLMQGLTRQLNGSFHIENDNGLHITIRFAALKNNLSDHPLLNH